MLDETPAGIEYVTTWQAPVVLMWRKTWRNRRQEEVTTVAYQMASGSRQLEEVGGGSTSCSCQAP